MAKWGEGDPRWIVEDRPDAINVNNWHWKEKNASQWSKIKLEELLKGLIIDEQTLGRVEIKEITSIDGEALVNNRKAKLIFLYEWNVKGEWVGYINGSLDQIKGEFEIPNLSEENEPDEIDVNVTLISTSDKSSDALKEVMRSKGAELVRKQIAKYIDLLKNDFARDLILPTKDSDLSINSDEKSKITINKLSLNKRNGPQIVQKDEVKTLDLHTDMKCRADELYRALIMPEMVAAFCRSQVKIDLQPGGEFVLFDGNISGTFVNLEENKLIKQKWRFKGWPKDHYSDVIIKIEEKEDHCVLRVHQTGIPSSDFDRTENGWNRLYFESMKRTFGFGSMLF